jgi:hypothetical protein
MELKTKIKETLLEERKRKLEEAFSEIEDIRDDSFKVERIFSISSKLLEEGYTIEEIDVKGELEKLDWKSVMGDAALNTAKEYIIRFILVEVFGAGQGFSTSAAQFFANYNPLNLLKPFKSMETCMSSEGMPALIDGLLTVMLRYIAAGEIGADRNDYSIGIKSGVSAYAGNMLGQVIKESNISETLADKVCKFIH